MSVDVTEAIKELISDILGDREQAAEFASDPGGTLAAHGITEADLSGVDIKQIVADCAAEADLPPESREALGQYAAGEAPHYEGGPTPPEWEDHHTAADLAEHINYITYVTYQGDSYVLQQLDYTNIDNSTDVDVDGHVYGDVDTDVDNNNATGDGAQVIDGDNYGQANTGDDAAQVGGDNDGVVNTGENKGVIADGDVDDTVIGDDNETVQNDGDTDGSTFHFGEGDVANLDDSHVTDSALSAGGDSENVSHNTVDDGSALNTGGYATGHQEDTDVDAHDSVVATEQGYGDQYQEVSPGYQPHHEEPQYEEPHHEEPSYEEPGYEEPKAEYQEPQQEQEHFPGS